MASHLVCSRDGLWSFDEKNNMFELEVSGHFFGIARSGNRFYISGHEGVKNIDSKMGSVWSFEVEDGHVVNFRKQVTGLDNGVHQITIVGNFLYAIETYLQRVSRVAIRASGDLVQSSMEWFQPWKPAINYNYDPTRNVGYHHLNALVYNDGKFYVMKKTEVQSDLTESMSCIQEFDENWNLVKEWPLGRWYCHDIVFRGSDIYFCDALNFICKLDTKSGQVTEVTQLKNTPWAIQNHMRGLCMDQGDTYVSSYYNDWRGLINVTKGIYYELPGFYEAATQIVKI